MKGSIGAPIAVVVLVVAGASSVGCVVDDRRYGNGGYASGPVMSIPACPSGAASAAGVSIDTNELLTTAVGEGTGVFVEYQSGGHWHIWTSCDTLATGSGCSYDITAEVLGGNVTNVHGEDLETSDVAGSACPPAAYLSVITGSNIDGVFFDAPEGMSIRVTAALGGALYPDLIYWVSGAVARSDAHSNPLDLTPTAK